MKNKVKIPLSIALLSILAYSNQGISSLPQQCLYYLTRESWHLNASTIGLISWVVGLAWYIKVFWGYIADKVQNTKNCLIISYLLMLGLYAFIIAFGLNLLTLIITGLLINVCIGFADTNVDKQMVITEQKYKLKGRLQAIQWTALGVGGLIVALGGAYIAKYFPEHINYKVAYGLAGIIPICMLIYLFKFYKNKRSKKGRWECSNCDNIEYSEREIMCWKCGKGEMLYKKNKYNLKENLKKLKSPKLIVGLIFIACLNFCPSFGTALMIKLRETMGVDKLFLGYLGAMGTILGIVGYLIYYKWAYKFPMKKLLYFMVTFAGLTNLFYLYIPNQWFLAGYNLAFGAFGGIAFMTLLAFFVTIIPAGSEGLFYALVTSVSNFSARGGNYIGGLIYDKMGYSVNVLLSSGLTLLCIAFVPFLKIGDKK